MLNKKLVSIQLTLSVIHKGILCTLVSLLPTGQCMFHPQCEVAVLFVPLMPGHHVEPQSVHLVLVEPMNDKDT